MNAKEIQTILLTAQKRDEIFKILPSHMKKEKKAELKKTIRENADKLIAVYEEGIQLQKENPNTTSDRLVKKRIEIADFKSNNTTLSAALMECFNLGWNTAIFERNTKNA